jgi:hypothetical protein
LQIAASKPHEEIVVLLLKFMSIDSDPYGHYHTAVSETLQEAMENVAATKASATSTEQLGRVYWEIYSLLLKHSTTFAFEA